MGRFRFKRPGTQIPSQTQNTNTFENLQPVQRDSFDSLQNAQPSSSALARLVIRGIKRDINRQMGLRKAQSSPVINTALMARRVPIDMSLPGEESPAHWNEFIKKNKWHRLRLVTTSGIAIVLIIGLTLGGLLFSENYSKLHKVLRGTATADPLSNLHLLQGQSSGRINLLLMGRAGGNNNQKANLTNTMIFASIDVINHDVKFISLPNNLWVANDEGAMTINQAFARGEQSISGSLNPVNPDNQTLEAGFKLADQTVSNVLGQPINYNIIINFAGLQQLVNVLGGINLNVPSALVDPTMAWQNNNQPTLVPAGSQTLNGKQTMLYVTSVQSTSESSRQQRQRQVLSAIFSKVTSSTTLSNPLTVSRIINTLGNNVASDLSMTDAAKLYQLLAPVSVNGFSSIHLLTANNQYLTASSMNSLPITQPVAGLFNYSSIHSYIASQLPNPYLSKEDASIFIMNGTNTPDLATHLGHQLSQAGYNVIGVANAPTANWTKTTLYNVNGGNPYTAQFLSDKLKIKVSKKPINKSIPTDGADFVIIIGNNETNPT